MSQRGARLRRIAEAIDLSLQSFRGPGSLLGARTRIEKMYWLAFIVDFRTGGEPRQTRFHCHTASCNSRWPASSENARCTCRGRRLSSNEYARCIKDSLGKG